MFKRETCEGVCIQYINLELTVNQGFPSYINLSVSTTLELEVVYHGFWPNLDIRNIKKDT